jgi:glycosyltransferase involved in cell wall biosynthesis
MKLKRGARPKKQPLLIFLVTEDWYFHSHRMPMARAAQLAGFEVAVITNVKDHGAAIEAAGVRVIPLAFDRRSLNPLAGLALTMRIAAIYRREKPALVHHIAMKPVLFGSIAAWRAGVPRIVNAFAGLGYVFSADTRLTKLLRPFLLVLFGLLLRRRNSFLLFQNRDDYALMRDRGLVVPGRARIIRGSGVDLSAYPQMPLPPLDEGAVCVFAGRMIGIKGLPTLKEAFAILSREGSRARLWLCGRPDPANPGSWTEEQLKAWVAESDNVFYIGHADMAEIWAKAHIALQPSYGGEGVPKALLEAAACGRPIVASDVPGCREVVEQGANGYLVPPGDAAALAARIAALAADPARMAAMARHSREIVASDMSADAVTEQTREFYRECLAEA